MYPLTAESQTGASPALRKRWRHGAADHVAALRGGVRERPITSPAEIALYARLEGEFIGDNPSFTDFVALREAWTETMLNEGMLMIKSDKTVEYTTDVLFKTAMHLKSWHEQLQAATSRREHIIHNMQSGHMPGAPIANAICADSVFYAEPSNSSRATTSYTAPLPSSNPNVRGDAQAATFITISSPPPSKAPVQKNYGGRGTPKLCVCGDSSCSTGFGYRRDAQTNKRIRYCKRLPSAE